MTKWGTNAAYQGGRPRSHSYSSFVIRHSRGEVAGAEVGVEVVGGADAVLEDGVVDVVAANGVGVGGKAVPEVLEGEDGEAGLGGEARLEVGEVGELAARGVREPEGEVDLPLCPGLSLVAKHDIIAVVVGIAGEVAGAG